jgi:hypothetical protein
MRRRGDARERQPLVRGQLRVTDKGFTSQDFQIGQVVERPGGAPRIATATF